jgi:hypothetical protein
VKERGILFSDEMVRALLAGTKTQTRRVVKTTMPPSEYEVVLHPGDGPALETFGDPFADDSERRFCPYGGPGDRLWVRECFALTGGDMPQEVDDAESADGVVYRAGGATLFAGRTADGAAVLRPTAFGDEVRRWRPSIFMPRWASRITLEITDVRVQRLQDISEEDARAEGVRPVTWGGDAAAGRGAQLAYAFLWNSIHGGPTEHDGEPGPLGGAWATNPWVWALTFKRVAS